MPGAGGEDDEDKSRSWGCESADGCPYSPARSDISTSAAWVLPVEEQAQPRREENYTRTETSKIVSAFLAPKS